MLSRKSLPAIRVDLDLVSVEVPGLDWPVTAYQVFWFYPNNTVAASIIVSSFHNLDMGTGDEVIIHRTDLNRASTYSVMVLAAQGAERITNWLIAMENNKLELRKLYQWHLHNGNAKPVHIKKG